MRKRCSFRTQMPGNILATLMLIVLVLALSSRVFADDRPLINGPDLSSLPAAILPTTNINKTERKLLSELGKLDPILARKIEKKLKSTPDLRDRLAYMHKQAYKLERAIDYVELNYKTGLASKNSGSIIIQSRQWVETWLTIMVNKYEDYIEYADVGKKKKDLPDFYKIYQEFYKRYGEHRSERRKKFGLHKEEGKTEPLKKAGKKPEKPEKPEKKKTKKVCSGGSLTEGMKCVDVLMDQDG